TFNTKVDVRSDFSCTPDPNCTVQPIVEPKLDPIAGTAAVTNTDSGSEVVSAGGPVDIGYLGCTGFASEAPNATFDTTNAGPNGSLTILYSENGQPDLAASVLVQTPSGKFVCSGGRSRVAFNPFVESGLYKVWVAAPTAETPINGTLFGQHLQPI